MHPSINYSKKPCPRKTLIIFHRDRLISWRSFDPCNIWWDTLVLSHGKRFLLSFHWKWHVCCMTVWSLPALNDFSVWVKKITSFHNYLGKNSSHFLKICVWEISAIFLCGQWNPIIELSKIMSNLGMVGVQCHQVGWIRNQSNAQCQRWSVIAGCCCQGRG